MTVDEYLRMPEEDEIEAPSTPAGIVDQILPAESKILEVDSDDDAEEQCRVISLEEARTAATTLLNFMSVNPHIYSMQQVSLTQQLVTATFRAQIANLASKKQAGIKHFFPVATGGAGGAALVGSSLPMVGAGGTAAGVGMEASSGGMFEGDDLFMFEGADLGMFEGADGTGTVEEGMFEGDDGMADADAGGMYGSNEDLMWCPNCQQEVEIEFSVVAAAAACVHCYRVLECVQY